MRIAIVGPTAPYKGGIPQHTTRLAHRLRAAGHDVVIESWARQYPERLYPGVLTLDHTEVDPFPHVRARLSWNRPDSWWRVGARLGRTVDAVVLVQVSSVQQPANIVIARRARRAGVPVCAIAHNVLPHEPKPWDPPLVRTFYRSLSGLVVHSDAQAAEARRLGAANVAIATLPFFYPGGQREAAAQRTNTLLFFGFIREYKGLDDLLTALAATAHGPRLIVVGENWGDDDQLRNEVARLGLLDRVDLRLGYASVDQLAGAFAEADALVVPYRDGTGSQHPRMAFQHGLPVIATTVGDLRTQVRDGVDGLLVPPRNAKALARAITRLYSGDELERLRSHVRPPDVDAEWQRYVEVVEGVLANR